MSVLIKGMEMPTSCHFCEMYEADLYWCRAAKRDIDSFDDYDNRSSFCPLATVPPHGSLIDRGGIKWIEEEFEERCHNDRWTVVEKIAYKTQVDKLPTIIPAYEEGE